MKSKPKKSVMQSSRQTYFDKNIFYLWLSENFMYEFVYGFFHWMCIFKTKLSIMQNTCGVWIARYCYEHILKKLCNPVEREKGLQLKKNDLPFPLC